MCKRCCFAGHNQVYTKELAEKLTFQIENLIKEKGITEFWVGNYGSFDRHSAHVINNLKKMYPSIKLNLVIPYLTKTISENIIWYKSYYDSIITPYFNVPKRYGILKVNEYMIDNCNTLVCYIEHSWGGAYKTFLYAQKKNISIINLNDTHK